MMDCLVITTIPVLIITTAVVIQGRLFASPEHTAADVEIKATVVPGSVVERHSLADLLPLREPHHPNHQKQEHYKDSSHIH